MWDCSATPRLCFFERIVCAVTAGGGLHFGADEHFNVGVCNRPGTLGQRPTRAHRGGVSRCNLRLTRGRGIGTLCGLLRERFCHCCSGTEEVSNIINRGLLSLLRAELSGLMCHTNFTHSVHRTHRVIDRNLVTISKGGMSVPSCPMHPKRIVALGRTCEAGRVFGRTFLRLGSFSLPCMRGDFSG